MIKFFQSILPSIAQYSSHLDKISIILDKPWSLVDSNFEMQKLIFKRNHDLIMSKQGIVTKGKWEYYSEARSLLLDQGTSQILCNEVFINETVMILRLDGTDEEYFILANSNILPDLDVMGYLDRLRYAKLNITTRKLVNGEKLEIQRPSTFEVPQAGYNVTIGGLNVPDGTYKGVSETFTIRNNKIESISYEVEHVTQNGITLLIDQKRPNSYSRNDSVWIDGVPATNGKYKIGLGKFIHVKSGRISKTSIF